MTLCVHFKAPITSFFLSDPMPHVKFLNLRHNSFQTKEKTMVDQNGGKFERFSELKIAFYPNRSFFVEVHWIIYRIRRELIEH